jgi:iron complex outermembrane receptor protein
MNGFGRTATCVASLTMSSLAHAQSQLAPTAPSNASSGGVEEIVVTAQRRSERLQNVPIAVTVASAARLAAVGISNTQELAVVTPGLSAPQAAGFTQPHIRGVGSSTNGPGLEQPVATYIDGVYIASAPASLLTLNNVDRIEVLKGPQGTLFGRNATGGLIQVVTLDPKSTPSAVFNLTYANYQDTAADAYVTGPLADGVKADLAVRYETQQKGWGHNLADGTPVGDLPHDFAGRTKFLIEPGPRTQIRLALDYEDRDSRRDWQQLDLRQIPGTFNNPFFGGPFPQGGRYDVDNDVDQEFRLKSGGASLQVKQDAGVVTVQSITAFRKSRFEFPLDLDQTPENLINLLGVARDKQFSQELQLSSNTSGKLKYTAGLYYFYADDRYQPLDINFGPSLVSPVPGVPVTIRTNDRMTTNSLAGYAQASYEVLPATNLTLGGRYTYERKRLSGTSSFIIDGVDAGDSAVPAPGSGIPDHVSFKRFNYRIALDHKFGANFLGYLSYNTGFKSGGYNLAVASNPPYKPEDIKAFEGGLKSELFDRKLRINTAGYYYIYRNIQVGRYIDNSESIYNGARARIYGADVDAEAVLARGLTLTGGFSYNHARFTSFPNADYIIPVDGMTPPPGGVVSASATGNDLPFSPKLSFNVGGDYKLDLPIGTIELNATYYRTTRYFASADNVATQPAYDLINASISWTDTAKHLSARIWGKNLGNTYYSTSLIEASQGVIRGNGAPRTYGLTLGYKF